jgi:hypothetical protein
MQPLNDSTIDWTGIQPDQSPIGPLDANSFIVRLLLLSERAESLTVLRNAFRQQQSYGEQKTAPRVKLRYPPAKPGAFRVVSRSKRRYGVADAAPVNGATSTVAG